jgi:hypothetical protein
LARRQSVQHDGARRCDLGHRSQTKGRAKLDGGLAAEFAEPDDVAGRDRCNARLLVRIDGDAGFPVAALDRLDGFDPDSSVSCEVFAFVISDPDERFKVAR